MPYILGEVTMTLHTIVTAWRRPMGRILPEAPTKSRLYG